MTLSNSTEKFPVRIIFWAITSQRICNKADKSISATMINFILKVWMYSSLHLQNKISFVVLLTAIFYGLYLLQSFFLLYQIAFKFLHYHQFEPYRIAQINDLPSFHNFSHVVGKMVCISCTNYYLYQFDHNPRFGVNVYLSLCCKHVIVKASIYTAQSSRIREFLFKRHASGLSMKIIIMIMIRINQIKEN